MKNWWIKTAWPWFKENWWAVLLAPFAIIILLGMLSGRLFGRKVKVIDPTKEADERAKLEAETRAKMLEAEKQRLEDELEELKTRYEELQARFDQKLESQVEHLRNNPEALRELMLRVGPGRKP